MSVTGLRVRISTGHCLACVRSRSETLILANSVPSCRKYVEGSGLHVGKLDSFWVIL
jgi:hypothetical protein